MHLILKTLHDHSGELIHELTDEVGLTESEAKEFLRRAGPALVASCVWQSSTLTPDRLGLPSSVRDVLAGMSGERLAAEVGLSSARAWDGLRMVVPAVLRATYPGRESPPEA
jgi:hypothetical protein